MKVNSIDSANFRALNASRAAQERVIPKLSTEIVDELLASKAELRSTRNIDLELVPVDFKPMKREFELNLSSKQKPENPRFRNQFVVNEDSFLYTGGIPKNSMVACRVRSDANLNKDIFVTLKPEFDKPETYEQLINVLNNIHKNWLGLCQGDYTVNYIKYMTTLAKLLDSAKNVNALM